MTTTTTAPETASRTRTVVPVAVAVVLVVLVAGGLIWHHLAATPTPPYADPSAAGGLTICDADGHAVTSGSTSDPLGAVVVSDRATPSAYAGSGHTAALAVYQPRAGVGPDEWTGLQLNGASSYDDVARPQTTLDAASTTIAQFVRGYPAVDDGWLQLRLVLNAPGAAQGAAAYPAGDLHISGTTWTLTDPGTAACS